jgi:hypothetical protein
MNFPPLRYGLALYPRAYARGFIARKYKNAPLKATREGYFYD